MKFTAERDSILSALSFVEKYAAKDNKIPVIADVLIRAGESGVTFVATDMDRAASDTSPANVETPGAICIPATRLLQSVKGSSGSEVSIVADDKMATISCGKSKFKLPVLLESDFPDMPMLYKDATTSFTLDAGMLDRIEKGVAFATEDNRGRFFLTGVSWQCGGGKLEFVATDGKKFSLLSIDTPLREMGPIIVPKFSIPAWEAEAKVSISDMSIRFECGSQTVASKLIDASYPEYRRLVPKNETALLFDRAELMASLARMAFVADAKEHSIMFVGRDGVAKISAVTANGEAADEIAYNGDDFEIAFAHQAITPILASFDCETIEWRWAGHQVGATVHDPNDPGRIAFAMPYRDRRLAEFMPAYSEAAE